MKNDKQIENLQYEELLLSIIEVISQDCSNEIELLINNEEAEQLFSESENLFDKA